MLPRRCGAPPLHSADLTGPNCRCLLRPAPLPCRSAASTLTCGTAPSLQAQTASPLCSSTPMQRLPCVSLTGQTPNKGAALQEPCPAGQLQAPTCATSPTFYHAWHPAFWLLLTAMCACCICIGAIRHSTGKAPRHVTLTDCLPGCLARCPLPCRDGGVPEAAGAGQGQAHAPTPAPPPPPLGHPGVLCAGKQAA